MALRKRGRPALPATAKRSRNFTFRGTADLHEKLRLAAAQTGGTVSDEIVRRLVASLDSSSDEGSERLLSEPAADALSRVIAFAMSHAAQHAAFATTFSLDGVKDWASNPTAYDQAVRAAQRVLEHYRPPGKVLKLNLPGGDDQLATAYSEAGVGFANSFLEEAETGRSRISGGAKRAQYLHKLTAPLRHPQPSEPPKRGEKK